jgi:hypothetical protein
MLAFLLHVGELPQRLRNALLPIANRSFAGGPFAPRAATRIVVEFLAQRFDLRAPSA